MNNRTKLAYAYRIIAKLGWDDHTYTHLSIRSEDNEGYYIYPFGMRFCEVTPDNLLKVSYDGVVLEGSEFQYNKTGYIIHGSIYKARPDINAIFHIHTKDGVAVSSMKDGLLPLSQWSLHFYDKIAYHSYNSLALDDNRQGNDLVKDLDDKYCILLRNHGTITCGRTIHEAMFYLYHLEKACQAQVAIMSMVGGDLSKLEIPSDEICKQSVRDLLSFEKDLGIRDWNAWINSIEKF